MNSSKNNEQTDDDTIDIIELLSKIWNRKKFILKAIVLFGVVGVLVAVSTPNQYTASSMFTPNYGGQPSGSSGLKGLASLAGIEIGSGDKNREISPMLYGKILESVSFKQQLLASPLKNFGDVKTLRAYFEKNTSTSVIEAVKEYTIGLPSKIIGLFKEDPKKSTFETVTGVESVSEQDMIFHELIEEMLTLSINDKDGFIEMISKSKDPQLAAQIAKNGELILQNQIIEIQTKSSLELLSYLEEQYALKRDLLNKAQDRLSNFKDRNLDISTSSFSNVQRRLETELQTVTAVFQKIVSQFEEVKLQVTKDTPVFSIIKKVVLPNEKSGPKRSLIVIVWLFLGVVFSSAFVLFKEPIQNIFKEINSKKES